MSSRAMSACSLTTAMKLLPGSQGLRQLQDQFSHALLILFGITLIILLITCANLANLFLVSALGREREFSIRAALGAAPSRLVTDVFRSQLSPVVGGVAVGALLAWLTAKFAVGGYYFEIMLPGSLVGLIVGFATQKYGRQPAEAH